MKDTSATQAHFTERPPKGTDHLSAEAVQPQRSAYCICCMLTSANRMKWPASMALNTEHRVPLS